MDITTATAAGAAIISAAAAARYYFQIKKLRGVLGKYTDEEIARHAPEIKTSGEVAYSVLMFIDISSFTTLSEKYKPAFVSRVLDIFFTTVCNNIPGGKVSKFLGDAVLVSFENNSFAIKSGMTLIRKLEMEFSKITETKISASIGIHSGDAYIGTIGNANRADFTMIGDAVNTTSRIQSLCKIYGEPLLISGDSMRGAKDLMPSFFPLDTVRVKGKKKAIDIFSVPNKNSEIYFSALSLYRSGEFTDALKTFEVLKNINPQHGAYEMWAERCRENISAPPQQWDGVFTMLEK